MSLTGTDKSAILLMTLVKIARRRCSNTSPRAKYSC